MFLPQTDAVFMIKDGCISESGTFTDLLNKNGTFADYVRHHMKESDTDFIHTDTEHGLS